jgi:hypothetical protein
MICQWCTCNIVVITSGTNTKQPSYKCSLQLLTIYYFHVLLVVSLNVKGTPNMKSLLKCENSQYECWSKCLGKWLIIWNKAKFKYIKMARLLAVRSLLIYRQTWKTLSCWQMWKRIGLSFLILRHHPCTPILTTIYYIYSNWCCLIK